MKISVFHPGKQHVDHLLKALKNKKILQTFYTAIGQTLSTGFISKLGTMLPVFGSKFKRRIFSIHRDQLSIFPLFLIFSRLLLINPKYRSAWEDEQLDKWFASKISKKRPDIIIGYELACQNTFRNAKEGGIITILDLASVHYRQNIFLFKNFDHYKQYQSAKHFDTINQRKKEEYLFTDYFFCLSNYAKESLVNNGIAPDRVYTTHLGINASLFSRKNKYHKHSKLRLLFVGQVSKLKGLGDLCQAIQELPEHNIELTIIGAKVDFEPKDHNIHHIPFLPQAKLIKYYQQADVFISPSYTDSWAQTVIEAMACGTPVIVSENTGSKDAVQQGGGFVIPVNDVEALKEKILYFYHNRKELERIGHKAHEIAQQYTLENYQKEVITAIEDIAQREGIPL